MSHRLAALFAVTALLAAPTIVRADETSLAAALKSPDTLQGFVFAESLVGGASSDQFTGTLHPFPAPALRVGGTAPILHHATDVLVEFDDREYAGDAHITNCHDALRSLACDDDPNQTSPHGSFDARDWIVQEHLGIRVPSTPVYADFANRYRASTYEKIDVEGVGFGLETLPPERTTGGMFGSALFFPNVLNEHGVFPDVAYLRVPLDSSLRHGSIPVRYSVAQYEVGGTHPLSKRFFFDGGLRGDSSWRIVNAPSEGTKLGLFVGTGSRL